MLQLAIVTPHAMTAEGIQQVAEESGVLRTIYRACPIPSPGELVRALSVHQPDVVLLDLGEWDMASMLVKHIKGIPPRGVLVGFRPGWTRNEARMFEEEGIQELIEEPFSPDQLQARLYDAVHRKRPIDPHGILAFLPAKAGSGSSTIALNTAAALAQNHPQRVLMIEADRRSGVLSILLNLPNQAGLNELLAESHQLSELVWRHSCQKVGPLDILASNPFRRGRQPGWADYYQLLEFAQNRYDYVVVDLPEVVNPATAELVRSAASIFIVSTPEVPSLTMAGLRSRELADCEIPPNKVHVIINRHERTSPSAKDAAQMLGQPVFATLPNDYREVKDAIADGRPVDPNSRIGRGCEALARQIIDRETNVESQPSRFALLRKLSQLTQ